jgi:hypothetical protein
MQIKVSLSVRQREVLEDVLTIDDAKLEHLTEHEIERAIEINISEWANRNVSIAWEVVGIQTGENPHNNG